MWDPERGRRCALIAVLAVVLAVAVVACCTIRYLYQKSKTRRPKPRTVMARSQDRLLTRAALIVSEPRR